MTKGLNNLAKSKTTTVLGGLSAFTAIVISLIPSELRATCMDAITTTENPLFTGGLLVVGLVLTLIGPSLRNQS